jgi:hypothetical protein
MHDGARSHLRSVSIEHTEAKCGTAICQKTVNNDTIRACSHHALNVVRHFTTALQSR